MKTVIIFSPDNSYVGMADFFNSVKENRNITEVNFIAVDNEEDFDNQLNLYRDNIDSVIICGIVKDAYKKNNLYINDAAIVSSKLYMHSIKNVFIYSKFHDIADRLYDLYYYYGTEHYGFTTSKYYNIVPTFWSYMENLNKYELENNSQHTIKFEFNFQMPKIKGESDYDIKRRALSLLINKLVTVDIDLKDFINVKN